MLVIVVCSVIHRNVASGSLSIPGGYFSIGISNKQKHTWQK